MFAVRRRAGQTANLHHSAAGQAISKNTTKLFIAQRFDACHFPAASLSSTVGPEAAVARSYSNYHAGGAEKVQMAMT
jgi:hypothetical protein